MPMPSGTPALLTRMSIGPTDATAAATASPSVTSNAATTAPLDGVGHRLGSVRVQVVDDHRRPVVGQRPHDALTHALAATGHQRPPAGQVEGGHQPKLSPAGFVPLTIDSARAVTIGFRSSWGRIHSLSARMASTTMSATTDGSMPVPLEHRLVELLDLVGLVLRAAEAVGSVALGLEDAGLDQSRAEDADAHAGALELEEEGLGQGDDAVLGHAVRAEGGHGQDPGAGRRVDDVAVALLDHPGPVEPGQVHDLLEVDPDQPVPGRLVHVEHGTDGGDAGVGAQHVDDGHVARQGLEGLGVGDVDDMGLAPEVGDGLLESGLVDVDQHQLHAFRREPLGHGPPDPTGRAGDERGLALEGVHGVSYAAKRNGAEVTPAMMSEGE